MCESEPVCQQEGVCERELDPERETPSPNAEMDERVACVLAKK